MTTAAIRRSADTRRAVCIKDANTAVGRKSRMLPRREMIHGPAPAPEARICADRLGDKRLRALHSVVEGRTFREFGRNGRGVRAARAVGVWCMNAFRSDFVEARGSQQGVDGGTAQ